MNNELQLYDIYEHWHLPFWQTQWFMVAAVVLSILALIMLFFFLFKKYYRTRLFSPSQQALRDLEFLKKKKIATREDAHAAYFAMTAILKKFFQSNFGLPFESMSDYEMIAALKKTTMPTQEVEQLEHIVQASVTVKYGREQALKEDVVRAIDQSIATIKQLTVSPKK